MSYHSFDTNPEVSQYTGTQECWSNEHGAFSLRYSTMLLYSQDLVFCSRLWFHGYHWVNDLNVVPPA